jgi:transcriptional regulator of arginine metabolism
MLYNDPFSLCIIMKSYRQSTILEIVDREAISSQEQLRERLRARGIEATQATHARDIHDLGLIKRPVDGAYRRGGTAVGPEVDPEVECRTAVDDYLRHYDVVDQLVVLKTDAGQAQPLAVAIDRAGLAEIVGTIAGDDTILVICRSAPAAAGLSKRLEEWRTS